MSTRKQARQRFTRRGERVTIRCSRMAMNESEPDPLPRSAIESALRAMERGTPYKAAFEELLLELDDATADRTMQLQREARGTWLLMLRTPARGTGVARALLVGNALSGTSI